MGRDGRASGRTGGRGCGTRVTLANLFQLYTHDFSEHWAGHPEGGLGEDGRFEPYPFLDSYWTEADRSALLIRADGQVAGFALVNTFAHSRLATDFSMAEFFVARKYRRLGVGHAAAAAVICERPGQWEIAVTRTNLAAQAFWRRVVATTEGVETYDRADTRWDGLILRFVQETGH
ncbi:GNAT family N-acetyltransferase [Phenylobacterium sp.]|uniref:GNAT family N-acetyltransferase n=1 Tax=Phenylobacterium sp. TaxID=1871053 RepID=UPI003983A5BC